MAMTYLEKMEDPAVWRDRFSVGGLKYIVDSHHRTERLFWTIFVTLGTVLVTLLLVSTVKNFTDNPVASTLDDGYPLKKVPFPSVTVCKVRPGLEQYGLVEAALNWIDPADETVSETVSVIESFVSSLFPMNLATIMASGTGTKLVAFLYLDGTQGQLPRQMAERFDAIMTGVKDVINTLMEPLLGDNVGELKFLDVNSFFVETAINWDIIHLGNPISQRYSVRSRLYQECERTLNSTSIFASSICSNPIGEICKAYCDAYDAILKNRRLQTSLLEYAISPPTVLKTNQEDTKPWYVNELAKKFKTVAKPPNYDPEYKSFALVPKCYYAKTEVGVTRSPGDVDGDQLEDYVVCDDFQQTVTDIGVCATFHAAKAISVAETSTSTKSDDGDKRLETKGTGGYTGLTVVLSSNLMYWQLQLVEPLLVRTHDSNSFGTFIASDFTDVDKEAIQLPVMYQSDVALSVKVVETDDGFKNLDQETRKCYLKGTDEHEFALTTWAPYTRGNCVLDCKLSRAAKRCGCVPWYLNYKRPDIGYGSCEIFGHRCFMDAMMSFTSWDEDADVINVDDEGYLDHDPCVCLPECDEYAYYSRLAATSAQKLRAQKFGWMSLKPRQNSEMPCAERFEGRLLDLHCDPTSGLYKQRLGDFFAPQKVNTSTSSTSDWEYDTAVASVYFDRAKQLATVKRTVPLTTIMAQVGGTMGLYTQLTGWSFISLLHLLIIMAQASFTCAIYSKRQKLAIKRAK